MKRNAWALGILLLCSPIVHGQKARLYSTTSAELIFSFGNVQDHGTTQGSIIRFAPVFNLQYWVHYDFHKRMGLFSGLAVRNVGFIYQEHDSPIKKKFRTYNLGLPVAFKWGNPKKFFLFAGYELEIPINYKEKTFDDGHKTDKFNVWFGNRTPTFSHSFMIGIQLPLGTCLKFKYYLSNFFNPNYEELDSQGNVYRPYAQFNAHVFYFSLNLLLLRNTRPYHAAPKQPEVLQAMW
jgi:hypothetical protein